MDSSNPNLLAVDTATEACSVALYYRGNMFSRFQVAPQKHANLVLQMVDEVLKEAKAQMSEIDLFGFGAGPGSFTGVRIAVATVQGLALGQQKNVFGITELKSLAFAPLYERTLESESPTYALSAIDARMGQVYYALYKCENSLSELASCSNFVNTENIIDECVANPQDVIDKLFALENIDEIIKSGLILRGTGIEVLNKEVDLIGKLKARGYGLEEDMVKALSKDNERLPDAVNVINAFLLDTQEVPLVDPALAEPLYCRDDTSWKKINE